MKESLQIAITNNEVLPFDANVGGPENPTHGGQDNAMCYVPAWYASMNHRMQIECLQDIYFPSVYTECLTRLEWLRSVRCN